jgi:hypothetical protein
VAVVVASFFVGACLAAAFFVAELFSGAFGAVDPCAGDVLAEAFFAGGFFVAVPRGGVCAFAWPVVPLPAALLVGALPGAEVAAGVLCSAMHQR